MKKRTQCIRLFIDSQLEDIVLVAMAVRGICAITEFSVDEVNRMELCIVEITNNVIEHAYSNEVGKTIEILINLSSDMIEIVVSDWGTKMEKKHLDNDPAQDAMSMDIDALSSSGRGINIVKKIMDDVNYVSSDGKNSFYMSKHLN
ncbi:MAG: ATP-binding protein [Endozoicomonadaceae bacterium]|nr:ATP-binding protein [Endozoicomonadaceae bacterium]